MDNSVLRRGFSFNYLITNRQINDVIIIIIIIIDLSCVSLISATPDWLQNILKPTQRASMCSPSSQLTSKTRGKTPTKVRERELLCVRDGSNLFIQIQKLFLYHQWIK